MGCTVQGSCKRTFFLFTMIELMTVISIIMILASIMIPTLMMSKRSAHSVYCKNNLKQLSLTNIMYANTYDHLVPWGADRNRSNLQRWYGRRAVASNTATYDPKRGPLYSYLKGDNIIRCPEFSIQNPMAPTSTESGSAGYGYNFDIGTGAYLESDSDSDKYYTTGVLTTNIHNPSDKVMFSDAATNVDNSGNNSNAESGQIASYSITNAPFETSEKMTDLNLENDPSIYFLHNGKANISWCDGHVNAQRMEWTKNSIWKKKHLGFFGSNKDNSLFNPVY